MITIVIPCSEEACVTITTLMPLEATIPKNLLVNPGIPTIPLPSTVIAHTSGIAVSPLTIFLSTISFLITVPFFSGSKVLLTLIGIRLFMAGIIVGG